MQRSRATVPVTLVALALTASGCASARDLADGPADADDGIIYGRIRGNLGGQSIVPLVSKEEFDRVRDKQRAFCYTIRLRNADVGELVFSVPESGVFACVVPAGTYTVEPWCSATWPRGDGELAAINIFNEGIRALTHTRMSYLVRRPTPLGARTIEVAPGTARFFGDQQLSFSGRIEEATASSDERIRNDLTVVEGRETDDVRAALAERYPGLPQLWGAPTEAPTPSSSATPAPAGSGG